MRRTVLALVLVTAIFAGCGGDDEESSATPAATAASESGGGSGGGGGATLKVSAPSDGSLKFDQSSLSAKVGKVTIEFSNPSPVPHGVEIEGQGVEEETDIVTKSDAAPLTVDLKPGEYEYYCPVGQHRQAGMEGTLTVK